MGDVVRLIPSQPPRRSQYAQTYCAIAPNASREHRQGERVVILLDSMKERLDPSFRGSHEFCLLNGDHRPFLLSL